MDVGVFGWVSRWVGGRLGEGWRASGFEGVVTVGRVRYLDITRERWDHHTTCLENDNGNGNV